jgi:anti-sigma factor RsiW
MKAMTCESGVAVLMEYLEGTLADDVRAAVDAHVSQCPRCVAFIASYRATPQILRKATAVEMPAALAQSLQAACRARFGRDR